MSDVAEVIRRAADSMPPPSADPERVRRTVRQRKTRHRITAGGVALVVAAAGLALAVRVGVVRGRPRRLRRSRSQLHSNSGVLLVL